MKLTEAERAENRASFSAMSLPDKLGYIFEYYKFPLVLALIAAVALGSVMYNRLTHKDALISVGCANVSPGTDLITALSGDFVKAEGADPARTEVKMLLGLYLSRDATVRDHQYAYASRLKVMASVAGGQLDVLLMNREAFDIMASGGYLMPLEPLLEGNAALMARLSGSLEKGTVILRDNDVEHLLDESVPYQADTEEVVNGILISGFPLIKLAGFSGDVYLGVIVNSPRADIALRYIDYLTR